LQINVCAPVHIPQLLTAVILLRGFISAEWQQVDSAV